MKHTVLILSLAAFAAAAGAQTQPKSATAPAKPSTGTSTASSAKLPPGVPPGKGIIKTAFTVSLRYQDITVGAGPVFDPKMACTVKYTIWRAADGVKFDSTDDHRMPVRGADGKPVMGPDGKPKLGDPAPVIWLLDAGRLPVGIDQGFTGMKVGGKRRLFVPWQLGLGARVIPDRPDHPGLPAKSNLIWDVELVSMAPPPQQPAPGVRPVPGGGAPSPIRPPGAPSGPGAAPAPPAKPGSPGTGPAPPGPGASAPPATPQGSAAPAAPTQAPPPAPAPPQQQ
jgi:peptidylprolyl isomerase